MAEDTLTKQTRLAIELLQFDDIIKGIQELKKKVLELSKKKTNYEKLNDAYEVLRGLRDKLVEENKLEIAGHLVHTIEVIQAEQAKILAEERRKAGENLSDGSELRKNEQPSSESVGGL